MPLTLPISGIVLYQRGRQYYFFSLESITFHQAIQLYVYKSLSPLKVKANSLSCVVLLATPNNNSQHLLSPLFTHDTDLNILHILSHLVLMTTI